MQLSDVFFSDYFTFRAAITVDTSVYVPNGFSSADTSIFSEVVTEYVSRASTYDGEDWFPYPTAAGSTLSLALDTSSGDGKLDISVSKAVIRMQFQKYVQSSFSLETESNIDFVSYFTV